MGQERILHLKSKDGSASLAPHPCPKGKASHSGASGFLNAKIRSRFPTRPLPRNLVKPWEMELVAKLWKLGSIVVGSELFL